MNCISFDTLIMYGADTININHWFLWSMDMYSHIHIINHWYRTTYPPKNLQVAKKQKFIYDKQMQIRSQTTTSHFTLIIKKLFTAEGQICLDLKCFLEAKTSLFDWVEKDTTLMTQTVGWWLCIVLIIERHSTMICQSYDIAIKIIHEKTLP